MNKNALRNTVQQLFAGNKGLLAMDESVGTCNKRFAAAGIPQTVEMRRSYREIIVTTQGLNESIGGVIMYDETIRQRTTSGVFMADALKNAGIIPGIKVDGGTNPMVNFPGEKLTDGLDGMQNRLAEYKAMGARFAKWRAVIAIGEYTPTPACIEANVHALCRYAALCQESDIVPIMEPEVLMAGNHDIQRCYDVTEQVLKTLFYQAYRNRIFSGGIILKPNMIVAGTECSTQNSVDEVAEATVNCLRESVPSAVPAIAFLSGGQSPEKASAHLNAMNKNCSDKAPWILSFSFARAIQSPALEAWKGKNEHVKKAQQLIYERARMNALARQGKYTIALEKEIQQG